jgi:hypothetical protein
MPKYRFGRYGPHSNEAFEADAIVLRREGEISPDTQNIWRVTRNSHSRYILEYKDVEVLGLYDH